MKQIAIFSLALTLFSITAQARTHPYFALRGGEASLHENEVIEKRNSSNFGSFAVGLEGRPFRLELEYAYAGKTDFDHHNIEAQTQHILGQIYIDIPITRYVIPYVSGGAGVGVKDIKTNQENINSTDFAWTAGAGVGVKLTRNVTFDTGFRYIDYGTVELEKTNQELDFDAYETYFGARFAF